MPSVGFYCELIPSKRLRALPLLTGAAALLLGSLLVSGMPLQIPVLIALHVGWIGWGAMEIHRQACGAARVHCLRLGADGLVTARLAGGQWVTLELLPGSVVRRSIAWLRLRFPDGRDYGELLTGSAHCDRNWHALQLIWRQRRARFWSARSKLIPFRLQRSSRQLVHRLLRGTNAVSRGMTDITNLSMKTYELRGYQRTFRV